MSHSREAVGAAIAAAFCGVTLGNGISLRQAQAIDDRHPELSREAFAALARHDIVDD